MATGLGKTVVAALVLDQILNATPARRALVVAHREELLRQARDTIESWTCRSTSLEMAQSRDDGQGDVVVASVPSLVRRLDRYDPRRYELLVVDEAHHIPAQTYQDILAHFPAAKALGLTATADRLDGVGLGRDFESVAFAYELRDAIKDGWLAPLRVRRVAAEIDLATCRVTAGDLNEGDLERIMLAEAALHAVAEPTARLTAGRSALIFAVTVAHALALAEVLGRYVGAERVLTVSGQDSRDHRRDAFARFLAGDIPYLVNVMLATEGVDLPRCDAVVVARPTQSRALFAQMIGRGTRLFPGKQDLLVLDFVGNSGRHRLVSPVDLLGGDDEDVKTRATRRLEVNGARSSMRSRPPRWRSPRRRAVGSSCPRGSR
jgi:superfamily II DNA or RNA helicase